MGSPTDAVVQGTVTSLWQLVHAGEGAVLGGFLLLLRAPRLLLPARVGNSRLVAHIGRRGAATPAWFVVAAFDFSARPRLGPRGSTMSPMRAAEYAYFDVPFAAFAHR